MIHSAHVTREGAGFKHILLMRRRGADTTRAQMGRPTQEAPTVLAASLYYADDFYAESLERCAIHLVLSCRLASL